MKPLATVIVAALALVLQGGFASAHANATGSHCTSMIVTDYVSSDANQISVSQSWVNIIDGLVNFTTSSTGCVLITFSGVANASAAGTSETMHVRTLMDGSQICVPALTSDIFLEGTNPNPIVAASITHVCKNVTAGAHTVQMQFHSNGTGLIQLSGHVLTVTHN